MMSISDRAEVTPPGPAAGDERLFQFLDAMPIALFIAVPGARHFYSNLESRRLLGQDVGACASLDLTSEAYHLFLAGTDTPYPLDRLPVLRALAGETSREDDVEVLRPDGTRVPLEVWATPMRDPTGSVTHAIVAFVEIAARRRVEADLASQAALLELAHDGAFLTDSQARITYWNTGAERTYGYRRAEAMGLVYHDLLRTESPGSLAEIEATMERESEWEGEFVQQRSDGATIVVESRWAAHRGPDGGLLGAMHVNRDVTARKRAEEQLALRAIDVAQANVQLARSNEELEQFAYIASHDLAEPLRAISGPVSLLARRYHDKLDPEADQFIEFAVDGCRRMQAMIDDLLAFSRAGRVDGQRLPVDCDALLSTVLAELAPRIHEAGARVYAKPLPTVAVQANQLGQVFQNLIGNALKYVAPGVVPEVGVSAERQGTDWRICVTDNGIGIEPRHRDRIFGMFKRLHTRTEYSGTGIGLALCKRIVERNGGRIGVEDAPGGTGSRFWFTLPILAKDAP